MPRPSALIPLTAAMLVALAGCASNARHQSRDTSAALSPEARREAQRQALFGQLKRLAARQEATPASESSTLAPPPGLDPALTSSIPRNAGESDMRATVSLADAIETFAARAVAVPTQPEPKDPAPRAEVADDDEVDDAQVAGERLYVSGRQKLLSGDTAGALLDLREATKLDPLAHEPWRELGEAYLAGGSRTEALDAFRAAIARGGTSPRTLELIARAAGERGDSQLAAAWYARASQQDPERFDPVLSQVVYVGLSQSLRKEGYLTAAKDALRRALTANATLSASTRYSREAGEVFRRQGDLWRDVGDDELRLGQYARAMQAYQRADDFPSLDGQPITPRVVFAAMRAGQPASGALYVLQGMADRDGRIGAGDLAMLRHLASVPQLASAIVADLREMRETLPRPTPPSIDSSLARAIAAVESPEAARRTLSEAFLANPADTPLARALLSTYGEARPAVDAAVALSERDPRSAMSLADALLCSDLELAKVDAALAAHPSSAGAALVEAYWIALQGRPAQGAARLTRVPGSSANPAVALALGDLTFASGRAVPDSLIAAQLASDQAEARRAAARLLMLAQRHTAAVERLKPLIEAPPARESTATRIGDLLLAADLNGALGNGELAESRARQAAKLDPFDDRPVSLLLSLLGPGGPASAPGKLNAVVRDLRTSLPESRTARLLRSREALRRSLLTLAEREALALAADDPGDAAAVDTLMSVWQRQQSQQGKGSLSRASAWLEQSLSRRPQSAPHLAGVAALLVAQEKPDAAAERLRAALAQGAGPDVSRTLERILREDLKVPADADALTRARVEVQPRALRESLDLAELCVRAGDVSAGVKALVDSVTPEVTLVGDQSQRLLGVASSATQRAVQDLRPSDSTGATAPPPAVLPASGSSALAILNLAATRSLRLSPELHQARLFLLALSPGAGADDLLAPATLAAQQHSDRGTAAYLFAAQQLRASGKPGAALDFLERVDRTLENTDADLAGEWYVAQVVAGDATRARVMIDRLARGDGALLKQVVQRFSTPEEVAKAKDLRAEAAYILGNFYSSEGREEQSMGAFDLALSYEPEHAWAANNLGYALADKGRDIERASKLLETAYSALPDEAPIVDSLGWLRYKQHILGDQTDPSGFVVETKGAVPLLRRAAQLVDERGLADATVHDHAGDACWLMGRFEEGRDFWLKAQRVAQGVIDQAAADSARPRRANQRGNNDAQPVSPARLQEAKRVHESVTAKLSAAAAGGPVKLAPTFANSDPRPRLPVPQLGAPRPAEGRSNAPKPASVPAPAKAPGVPQPAALILAPRDELPTGAPSGVPVWRGVPYTLSEQTPLRR